MLKIADNLKLPLNAVTQKFAWLGRTGSGKTYGATKLAEEMLRTGCHVVALDPVGVWYGLRIAADGKAPGIAIPVFGGLHGDVPLEPGAGQLLADLIVDRGISAILDVSQFESNADKARFAEGFAARFFYRKKASPSAIHLFVEEAQEFIPQNPARGEERMLGAFERLIKLGRNFGIGASLISQRPQEVNKKALNQTECLFAFQMTGTHERKAVELWIADKGLDEDISGMLPKLAIGEPHVWSPQWLQVSKTVRILPKWTFNASSTPEVGRVQRAEVKPLDEKDLAQIKQKMAATIERAKAEDPRELQRQVRELKAQLAKQRPAAGMAVPADPKAMDKARGRGFEEGQRAAGEQLGKMRRAAETIRRALNTAIGALGQAREAAIWDALLTDLKPVSVFKVAARPSQPFVAPPFPQPLRRTAPAPGALNGKVGKGEIAVLTAIAQHEAGVAREQLSVLTGYKRSTRDLYLQRLSFCGLVKNGPIITATAEGIAALGDGFEALPTGSALREYWLGRLQAGERKILDILIREYPTAVLREALDEQSGYRRSTRDLYLQKLSSRRLIERVGGGVRASKVLFDE